MIETAAYYRNLVEKEKDHFNSALQNQNQLKVTSRQTEAQRLRDQIDRNKAEIVRLQDEIAAYLQQIDQTEAAVKMETEKLEKARTAFEFTHQSVLLQIDKDIENLHKYL